MKILYVTTVAGSMVFFPEHFKMLMEEGHTVELACSCERPVRQDIADMGLKIHDIPFSRSPISKENVVAFKQLKGLVSENDYDIVHCYTPNAAIITRLVCKGFRKKGLKVFYTAHGFHFYQGAAKKNWMIFYTAEWICAHWTDVLITINREDYTLAKRRMKAKKIEYMPGVGIDLTKFRNVSVSKEEKRKDLAIPTDAKLLLSVGELNANKNHETVIRAISGMDDVYYVIAGKGGLDRYLQEVIEELGIANRVKLLGFRTDVSELYYAADALIFPSYREGLSVALMEAMASSLPVACSKIRGNIDLIDENGGRLFNPHRIDSCREAIEVLLTQDLTVLGKYNREKVKSFSTEHVVKKLRNIYNEAE